MDVNQRLLGVQRVKAEGEPLTVNSGSDATESPLSAIA